MIEIKIVGRGGQGAVLASHLLAATFFDRGLFVQAFPSFGPERRGAPVAAFVRVSDRPIHHRCGVRSPDWLIAFGPELLAAAVAGLEAKTSVVANATQAELRALTLPGRLFLVDATGVAREQGLHAAFPLVNTAMVGAFARASGLLQLPEVLEAVRRQAGRAEENAAAVREAYERVAEVRP